MTRRTRIGKATQLCDVTHQPSPVCIPVVGQPKRDENGVPISETRLHVADWAIAKTVALDPEKVDQDAGGIPVPAAPSPSILDYLGGRRADTINLRDYLNEIHRAWEKAAADGYPYSVIIVERTGHAIEVQARSNVPLGMETNHECTVFENIKQDECLVCLYNTPNDRGFSDQPRNDCICKLLAEHKCPDMAVGNAVLVRRSLMHGVPLGMRTYLLKPMLGQLSPNSTLPRPRIRNRAAEAAQKRRKRMEERVLSEGVKPRDDEVTVVRVSADTINPFSVAVIPRANTEEGLRTLLCWSGQLAEFPVRAIKDMEVVVVAPDVSEPAEISVRRTGDASIYTFNDTVAHIFPGIPSNACMGPLVVALRSTAGAERPFLNYDIESFRRHILARPE